MDVPGIAASEARSSFTIMLAYWLVQFAAWLALLTPLVITIALKLNVIAGEAGKAGWLGIILGVGAAAAMVSAVIWGAVSDRTQSRMGRRKPWIIGGSLALLGGLTIMAAATTPLIFGLGWLVCQIGSNAAQAALNAVISDVIPEKNHGIMSALLGASITAAMITGVFISQFTSGSYYTMFLVPWLASPLAIAYFFVVVPDAPSQKAALERLTLNTLFASIGLATLRHRDFAWAFTSRFLVMFGATFAMTYQVYFLMDRLHVAAADVARFMVLSTSLMGGLSFVVSCGAGWLSDRLRRRKPFVIFAAALMALGLLGIAVSRDFNQFLVAIAFTSVGQGLYFAVDLALCVEVLPDRSDAARDMAVLQIANSLPQSLAPAIAPLLLAISLGGVAGANFFALFIFASSLAVCGAMAILPIRGVR